MINECPHATLRHADRLRAQDGEGGATAMMTNYRAYVWTQAVKPTPADHGPESWVADLRAAGWVEVEPGTWRSPDGAHHRGPYGAWRDLHSGYDNDTPLTPIPIPEDR